MAQRHTLVADDLAEEEVLRLDGGGAFVERVDLGVADVLLDRVVLQEAGPAEGLQALGELGVGLLGADTLDDRQQQVVDLDGQFGLDAVQRLGDLRVLMGRGEQVQRAQPLGVCLLGHQRAAHIRVVRDGDARRGLVRHLGQVRALHALLGVLESVEVAGGQRGDRLGAHHHPGLLDDVEHLGDAVVHLADQPAHGGGAVLAE